MGLSRPEVCPGDFGLEGLTLHPGRHVCLRLGMRQAIALPDLGDELRLVLDLGQVQIRERRPFLLGIRPVSRYPVSRARVLSLSPPLKPNRLSS